jgi:hypothetical protein
MWILLLNSADMLEQQVMALAALHAFVGEPFLLQY